jgi:hypothetical protein
MKSSSPSRLWWFIVGFVWHASFCTPPACPKAEAPAQAVDIDAGLVAE